MNPSNGHIVQCRHCGARNRIPPDKLEAAARCGKCKAPIPAADQAPNRPDTYMLRCTSCRAKNRAPAAKINTAAQCGKCGSPLQTEGLLSREPVIVSDSDFEAKVLKSPLPVLFLCWATWCPSCRIVIPVVDELAAEWTGRARIGKLNVDANPIVANRFQILSVPTLFIFDNGGLKETLTGALPKHELMAKMAPFL